MTARASSGVTRLLSSLIVSPTEEACRRLDSPLFAAAVDHGVAPLVAHALTAQGLVDQTPEAVRGRVAQTLREAAVLDAVARHEQARVIAAFETAGVRAVIFKGAALSATHYPQSWLRPRGDVDVLVSETQVETAAAALESIGYRRALQPSGVLISHQARFCAPETSGDFACDVHWRLADPLAFAGAFPFDDLWPASGAGDTPHVRCAAPVDALLIACVHRAAHHHDGDRLLLLYDIDRIARRLSSADWAHFVTLAAKYGVRTVCRRGLDLTATLFDTFVPHPTWASLAGDHDEPSALFVAGGLRRVDILRSDLARLKTWRERANFLREHLFPPRAYIATKYGCRRRLLLPWWYATRLLIGAVRWFRPLAPQAAVAR
jgi:hypothetical protein